MRSLTMAVVVKPVQKLVFLSTASRITAKLTYRRGAQQNCGQVQRLVGSK